MREKRPTKSYSLTINAARRTKIEREAADKTISKFPIALFFALFIMLLCFSSARKNVGQVAVILACSFIDTKWKHCADVKHFLRRHGIIRFVLNENLFIYHLFLLLHCNFKQDQEVLFAIYVQTS